MDFQNLQNKIDLSVNASQNQNSNQHMSQNINSYLNLNHKQKQKKINEINMYKVLFVTFVSVKKQQILLL